MKRIVVIIIACVMLLGVIVPATLAWLNDSTLFQVDMTSYLHKSYFESGDGTSNAQFIDGEHVTDEGCAFEIKYPVQLYYFAWLQYLGYFNQPIKDDPTTPDIDESASNTIDQTYFYLSADLDMTGWTLPPIGTADYPFVGNFDGNGHTISGLTIQNVNTGTDSSPTTMTDLPVANITGANIIGFFGIVGATNANGKVYGAIDDGGAFIPSNSESYSYSSEVNEIKNFALTNVTVKTENSPSLIGIVAGYVNGEVSNVRVGTSGTVIKTGNNVSATTYTSNLSDYTLMGYVTDSYKDTSDVVFAKVDTPTEANSHFNYTAQGASAGWGGSIDMYSLHLRLNYIFNTAYNDRNNTKQYITEEEYIYDEVTGKVSVNTTKANMNRSINGNNYVFYSSTLGGSYNIEQLESSGTSTDKQYMCLMGETQYLSKIVSKIIKKSDPDNPTEYLYSDAYYLHDGSGHYLSMTNDYKSLASSNQSNAVKWIITNEGYLCAQTSYGQLFLNVDVVNGNTATYSIEVAGKTTWNTNSNNYYCTINGTSYYLLYENSTWTVGRISGSQTYNTISYTYNNTYYDSTTYYLNYSGGSFSRGTSASTKWYKDDNNRIYTLDGKKMYIAAGNNTNITITDLDFNARQWESIGNTIYYTVTTTNDWGRITTTTYYLQNYNNTDNWRARTNNQYRVKWNQASETINKTPTTISKTLTSTQVIEAVRYAETYAGIPTFVPIHGSSTAEYDALSGNTGYIISGSRATYQWEDGDIRVSRYNMSSISTALNQNAYSGTRLQVLTQTAESNGLVRIDDNYNNVKNNISSSLTGYTPYTVSELGLKKYVKSREQLESVMSGASYIYGMHFMDALISMDYLVTAPKVIINGETIDNYEMPQDSIDFTLKEKGYVNFFAGTYYLNTGYENNSFFSLHQIVRDPNTNLIVEIKEIFKVYGNPSDNDAPYIYTYNSSDTCSEPGYELLFDLDWIKKPTIVQKAVYYYEIPVNEGEYALGSVYNEGENTKRYGAYLMYLDIGANAQLVDRAAVTETFEETVKTYEFPVGATFQNTALTSNENDVIPSALAYLTTSTTSNGVTITSDALLSFTSGTVNYIKDGVTVNNTLTRDNIPASPNNTTTTLIRRTTYYDYNVAKDRYTVTIVLVTQVNGGAKSVTINAWNTDSDWDIEGQNAEQIASMDEGITPNIGSNTASVPINSGQSQTMEYTSVDEVYCYLINVSNEENAQALRIDRGAFEGAISINDELYQFSYAIKDNEDGTNGATIAYNYTCSIAFNPDAENDAGLFAFSSRSYSIVVMSNESIITKVITPRTDNNYTITLSPSPS